MDPVAVGVSETAKTRVFISYSRKDREFAERLRDQLLSDDFDAYLDVHDIVKGEPWQERLQNLIFGADAVLFLISPDSVSSEICDWEVNEAERLAKRVLPAVCRMTLDEVVPGRLKRLNYTFLDTEEKWPTEYPKLCEALNRDIHWMREHTRLSDLAARWERDGRPEAQLLRLDIVRNARNWGSRRPADAELSEVLVAFLEASEEKESKDRERLLTVTGRAFVKPAEQALTEGRYDAALRLAAAGTLLGEDLDMRLVPERVRTVIEAAEAQQLRRVPSKYEPGSLARPLGKDTAGIASAFEDHTVQIGDAILRGHKGRLHSVSFSPDRGRIITASDDQTARIWDAATGEEIASLQGHESWVWRAEFSPDGTNIVTVSADVASRIWDSATDRHIALLWVHDCTVVSATFSSDSTRVVTASSDNTARIWDSVSGRELAVLRGHECSELNDGSLIVATFIEDGTRMVTASSDSAARIWDFARNRECAVLRGHQGAVLSATFGSDGARIVTASSDMTARIWDSASGRELAVLRGHDGAVMSATFSSDGMRIVTASSDMTARIWDSVSGRELAVLRGHEDVLLGATFSSDGTRIVTASSDGTARIWDVSRTSGLVGDPVEILAASLSNGRGVKAKSELTDLLMQAAPDDLYEALMEQLTPAQRESVARRVEILARPLHPNCYLAPSQRPSWRPVDAGETDDQKVRREEPDAPVIVVEPRPANAPIPAMVPKRVDPIAITILALGAAGLGAGALFLLARYGLLDVGLSLN